MSYKLYLGFIPFVNVADGIMQSSDIESYVKTSSLSSYTSVEVDNFRILNDGTISFIIDLGDTKTATLNFDQFNAVICPVTTIDYKFYRIRSIAYTSSTNYLITADPMTLNGVRSVKTTKKPLLNPNTVSSKSSFVEWGYAYDSIVDSNGKLRLDNMGGSDLYVPIDDMPEPTIPVYHQQIEQDATYYNTNLSLTDKNLINKYINKYVVGWVLYYLSPNQQYNDANNHIVDTSNASYNYANDDDNWGTLSYISYQKNVPISTACVCMPIINRNKLAEDNYRLIFSAHGLHATDTDTDLERMLLNSESRIDLAGDGDFTPYIIHSKVVKNIPFKDNLFYSISEAQYGIAPDITVVTIKLRLSYLNYDTNWDGAPAIEISGDKRRYLLLKNYNGLPRPSIVIYNNTLKTYGYPTGFGTYDQVISKTDLSSSSNPYIAVNSVNLKIRDMCGGEFTLTPLQLGRFNSLRFFMLESLTPDTTKQYVYVDTSYLTDSLLRANSKYNFVGMLDEIDNTYPYSKDQLDIFLANNKNFFLQKIAGTLTNGITSGIDYATGKWVAGAMLKTKRKHLSGVITNKETEQKGNIDSANISNDYFDSSMQILNLISSPDYMSSMSTNPFFSISVDGFGFFLDMYVVSDLVRNIAYRDFVEKGIHIHRYVDDSDVTKYLSITANDYDKKYYKYCKGNFNLYYNQSYNNDDVVIDNKLIRKLSERYKAGLKIFDVDKLKTDNPGVTMETYDSTIENRILENADEEAIK